MSFDPCPDCGTGRTNGLCPRCLVKLGIDEPGLARGGAGGTLDLPVGPGSVLESDRRHDRRRASRAAPRHGRRRGALADRPARGRG